jgi:hypothetical protein
MQTVTTIGRCPRQVCLTPDTGQIYASQRTVEKCQDWTIPINATLTAARR